MVGARDFPRRIVCLSAEAADILHRLGETDRLVGVSAYADIPGIPRVSGFSTANLQRVLELRPDLVIAYSYVQRELVTELIRAGVNVLVTHQTTLEEVADVMGMLARLVGRSSDALVEQFWRGLEPVRRDGPLPRVYFEEWPEPPVTGVAWVSELIERAGGVDIFADLRTGKTAAERCVTDAEILRRRPDIVIASWCGRAVDVGAIQRRLPGRVVFEVASEEILQPGPRLVEGYRRLCAILDGWARNH
ncbi:MAG: helical backbone metal receptor [Verrucomicrobiae bacterium]|nr:helical backbone metal receptor [Verrucomicrobiae bacterium]MDW8343437.1 helical backbone metal receptor [Verrucomicrobiae bacterium]